jgi:hypothetical protein
MYRRRPAGLLEGPCRKIDSRGIEEKLAGLVTGQESLQAGQETLRQERRHLDKRLSKVEVSQ